MLRVPIQQARPGMVLALPLHHPQSSAVLLTRGYTLDNVMVQRLHALHVRELWIEYPNTEIISDYVSPTIMARNTEVVRDLAHVFERLSQDSHAKLEYREYRQTLRGLIEAIVNDPMAASYIIELGGTADSELRHSAEVCFLSILLGLKLQDYLIRQRSRLRVSHARDVSSLGLGAMLHDIGVMELDPVLRRKGMNAYICDDPMYLRHVELGHRLVSGRIDPSAAGIVLHHHQHYDGSGYPHRPDEQGEQRGLAGEHIHIFARICCVADHFDRLRSGVDGRLRPRVEVLHRMLVGPLRQRFDPEILRALPEVVPAFAPGSIVRLSDASEAVVVSWDPADPCRPTVQRLVDGLLPSAGGSKPPDAIDLRKADDLHIVEQDGVPVEAYLFELSDAFAEDSDEDSAAA